ncbi:uncharacterized protein SPPG_01099 [Spizellomyces punctatus DAOM BR117]|uniref:Calcineurin-like phosphoesterase domain-containing protein n=1 Tax=Spizellomyces punctatus (strain DAOM BR117) TaxID=645134 RepID=A0A0L0HRE8_SPIPD|nr:uncharacterized protein SPPG_01099 [Spizellomyces punctatus DAOM BR117]KND03623.1 hypothetical protein SPPG_01099 [Spizellomyces punctatus DAOM BR117]|eukprot:XP_016611662.1 hypothetical protein SPPG_01099 [Spizellomyces punctatus DAOM BR117]
MSQVARILLVSDVHSKVDNVHRLAMCLQRRNVKPDLIVLCGDLVNSNHDYDSFSLSSGISTSRKDASSNPTISSPFQEAADTLARMRRQQEETEFRAILHGLGGVSKNIFYIPGNHDPSEAFPDMHPTTSVTADETETSAAARPLWYRMQVATGAINFHQRLVRLAPNLILAGFGGSVPQTLRGHQKIVHAGYPYTEKQMRQGVHALLKQKRPMLPNVQDVIKSGYDRSKAIPPNNDPDVHILVTHCGPASTGTTDINKTPFDEKTTRLESGSRELQELLSSRFYQGVEEVPVIPKSPSLAARPAPPSTPSKVSPNLLFHVHGHSHSAWGVSHLGKIPVINPGPLRDGRFAIATIEHGLGLGLVRRWILSSLEFATV